MRIAPTMLPTTRATGTPAQTSLPLSPGGARRGLQAFMAETGWRGDADSVALAVHEAVTNCDRHGGGVVEAWAEIRDDALEVVVCDRGPGFEIPPTSRAGAAPTDPLAENGRGLWLICHIASRAEASRRGAEFCLHLWFEAP